MDDAVKVNRTSRNSSDMRSRFKAYSLLEIFSNFSSIFEK